MILQVRQRAQDWVWRIIVDRHTIYTGSADTRDEARQYCERAAYRAADRVRRQEANNLEWETIAERRPLKC